MMRALLLALLLSASMMMPTPAFAQTPSGCEPGPEGTYKLGVPISGVTEIPKGERAFGCYVRIFYGYIIGLAVILASIVITYAGYIYLTSAGDPAKVTHSIELITGALSGLALLLLAATVLRWIGVGGTTQSGSQSETPITNEGEFNTRGR